jgi:hypothetical protein
MFKSKKNIALFLFFCGISACFASGGHQSLERVIDKAALIVKVKIAEVKKADGNLGHLYIRAEKVETIKGNAAGKILLLNFQAQAYAKEIKDKTHGIIKKWYMCPQSGKEFNMKKGDIWFLFSYSAQKDQNGFINIFRGEPTGQESKIKKLLKSKAKK